jgi:beta-lactamase superfamily II metal-dependent hydrolase
VGIEIDFLAVGEASKSGDAIAVRYGNLFGRRAEQHVVVIDGGYNDSGQALVDLIRTHYGTNYVDLVISTHPDQDHICGLEVVLEQLSVGELWMHQPWRHCLNLSAAHRYGFGKAELSETLTKSLEGASDVESIANRKGIPIREPFTGVRSHDGAITVVGPTQAYYESLLAEIQPETAAARIGGLLRKAAEAVFNLVPETPHTETLRDDGETSPQNNTSVITMLSFAGRYHLFTADAGIPALTNALDALEPAGFTPGMFKFVQVPHHGSRRNVGPTVLDRLLGPKGQSATHSTAFVSAAKEGAPKHPAKKVMNAFRRRGYHVLATQGTAKLHHHEAPDRPGYVPVDPLPFYDRVEEDEG